MGSVNAGRMKQIQNMQDRSEGDERQKQKKKAGNKIDGQTERKNEMAVQYTAGAKEEDGGKGARKEQREREIATMGGIKESYCCSKGEEGMKAR